MSSAILHAGINKIGSEHIMSTERDTQLGKRIALTLAGVILLHGIAIFGLTHIKANIKEVPLAKTIAIRIVSLTPDQPKPLPPKPIVKPKVVPVVKELPKPKPLPILVAPKSAVTPVAVAPVEKPIVKPTPIAEPVAAQPPAPVAAPQKAEPAPPKIVQGVAYLVPPKVNYPESARLSGAAGTTVVNAVINVNGTVDEVKIKSSSGNAILDKEALRAVKKALFKPHRENGVAIVVSAPVSIEFSMPEE